MNIAEQIPDLSAVFSSVINFLFNYWYWFVIIIFGGLAFGFWLKSKEKKITYFSQIEENKKQLEKELKYNPTDIKWIRHFNKKYKVLGQSYMGFTPHEKAEKKMSIIKEWNKQEIRDLEIFKLKQKITKMKMPKYISHKFLIQRSNFLGIYYGDKETLVLFKSEFTRTHINAIRIHSDKHLVYRKGLLVSQRMSMIDIIDDTTERLMADHYVDSRGQQMKDFSRIRTDYAHDELMKDKDIEVAEKEKKSKRHG